MTTLTSAQQAWVTLIACSALLLGLCVGAGFVYLLRWLSAHNKPEVCTCPRLEEIQASLGDQFARADRMGYLAVALASKLPPSVVTAVMERLDKREQGKGAA